MALSHCSPRSYSFRLSYEVYSLTLCLLASHHPLPSSHTISSPSLFTRSGLCSLILTLFLPRDAYLMEMDMWMVTWSPCTQPRVCTNTLLSLSRACAWSVFRSPPWRSYRSQIHTFFFLQFWTACVVFGPLLWTEIRWWSSSGGKSTRSHSLLIALIPIIVFAVANSGIQIPGLEILSIRWSLAVVYPPSSVLT